MVVARVLGRQAEVALEARGPRRGPDQRAISGCTGHLQYKRPRDLCIQVDGILGTTVSGQPEWQLCSIPEGQRHAGGGHRLQAVPRLHTVVARLRTSRPRQLH